MNNTRYLDDDDGKFQLNQERSNTELNTVDMRKNRFTDIERTGLQ